MLSNVKCRDVKLARVTKDLMLTM